MNSMGMRRVAVTAVLLVAAAFAHAQADDASALSRPGPHAAAETAIRVGTVVSVRMADTATSGANKNGDMLHAILAAPVKTSTGSVLPSGAKAEVTVVASAAAGTMQSAGVLSLQLTRIAGVPLITDVAEFAGKEGHKDVADSNPDKGTEAKVDAGSVLTFHVLQNGAATGLDLNGATHAREHGTVEGGSGTGSPAGAQVPPAPAGKSPVPPPV